MVSEKVNYCRLCLLPKLPESKEMSDTSFLFATLHCQCQKTSSDQVASVNPPDIEVVLGHALRKAPERCYRYMSEITIDLQRILQGKPLQFARSEAVRLVAASCDEANVSAFDPAIAKKNG